MQAIVQSLSQGLSTYFAYIPQLIGAIIILIVGYIVAKILQAVVGRVLQGIGFDGWIERAGIKRFFDSADTRQTPAITQLVLRHTKEASADGRAQRSGR